MLKTKRVHKPIDDIVIVESFSKTKPSAEKIGERYAEWRRTGVVPGEVMIDKYNRLFDGYAAYLVHRMIGSKNIDCLRVSGSMEDQKEKELERENKLLKLQLDALQLEHNLLKEALIRLAKGDEL